MVDKCTGTDRVLSSTSIVCNRNVVVVHSLTIFIKLKKLDQSSFGIFDKYI